MNSAVQRLTYQPALDGVRAVAVIMVLFFHAGFGWMGGGYVGVADVLRTASQSLDSSKPSENPRLR